MREGVVTLGIAGGDGAFVDPEEVDARPVEGGLGEVLEEQLRGGAAGYGDGGGGPLGERFSEDLQDVIATGFGGGQRVGAQYGLKVHVS